MFLSVWLGLLALMLRDVVAASAVWRDTDTGLTFASDSRAYKVGAGKQITYRVAIPGDAQPYTNYDIVVQIVAPNEVGWAGLAWGGSMARNPLFVVWKATDSRIVTGSSRWSNGHVPPSAYTGAQYTAFRAGTKSNNTHWQITAKCTGCATWTTPDGGTRYLSPRGGNRLAMAYSPTKPSQPNSNTSTIMVHDVHDYWSSEFNLASNANFATIVQSLQTF